MIMHPINCNLSTMPRNLIGQSCSLSAICVHVHPLRRGGLSGTIESRTIVLRDNFGECTICVWGDHVHMFDVEPIGRSVTLGRINLKIFANAMAICMSKDSSIVIGPDADVATAILQRLQL